MAHIAHLLVFLFELVFVLEFFKLFSKLVLVFDFFKRALLLKIFPKLFILFKIFLGPASFLDPIVDRVSIVIDIAFRFWTRYIGNNTTRR